MNYIVSSIDGDYAHLRLLDGSSDEDFLVALALLPEGVCEGVRLQYEVPEFFLMD